VDYSYSDNDLQIDEGLPWVEQEVRQLVREIFDDWHGASLNSVHVSRSRLRARIFPRTDGGSGAIVCQLEFLSSSDEPPLRRFIIRGHLGDDAAERHSKERRHIEEIARYASDHFACKALERKSSDPYAIPNLLVIEHASDRAGAELVALHDVVLRVVKSRKSAELDRLTESLSSLVAAVTRAYDRIGTRTLPFGRQIFERFEERLPPDVVIDLSGRVTMIDSDRILAIPDGEGAVNLSPESATPDDLLAQFEGRHQARWTKLPLSTAPQVGKSPHVIRFRAKDLRIWVRLADAAARELSFQKLGECRALIFHPGKDNVSLGTELLAELGGYDVEACVPSATLRQWCARLAEVREILRHNDVHCGNVLGTAGQQRLVDFGELQPGLMAADMARLEMDLWGRVAGPLGIEGVEAKGILRALERSREPDVALSEDASALHRIIRAVRDGARQGQEWGPVPPAEEALAYTLEALIHQRRLFEDKIEEVPRAVSTVARYWIERFDRLSKDGTSDANAASSKDSIAGLPSGGAALAALHGAPGGEEEQTKAGATDPIPEIPGSEGASPSTTEWKVHHLWREALRSEQIDQVTTGNEEVLQQIYAADSHRMNQPVWDLQERVLERCRRGENPFQSNRHVIVAAPTSTGKSTLAEMFLTRAALMNHRRRCALYIAPTRALAQAKCRELQALLAHVPDLGDQIALSTGEDTEDDRAIALGQFRIACMVYEKANILFSRNTSFLSSLGCIVIDEIHMLADFERGPTLEMVLTKAVDARRKDEEKGSRSELRDYLRVVAISTEDQPDPGFACFLATRSPTPGVPDLPPLELYAQERPQEVHHWLVLPGSGEPPLEPFRFLSFKKSKDRTLTTEMVAAIDQRLAPVMAQVREDRRKWSSADHRSERRRRLQSFLVKRLEDCPQGRRLLVFVPGRLLVEDLAQQMCRERSRGAGGHATPGAPLSEGLSRALGNAEDDEAAKVIEECARAGVFLHHADVDTEVRREIEKLSAVHVGKDDISQVLFCTETLSYGVNLAINDVIFFGISFPTSDRRRLPTMENLSPAAFHNMAGRCGRLRSEDSPPDANLFILVDTDSEPLEQVICQYYTKISPVQSQIFVVDDWAAADRVRRNPFTVLGDGPCAEFATLSATSFTYPFVRSVLDALRHLNLSGAKGKKGITDMQDSFFANTLYISQGRRPEERRLFSCAVQCVLRTCAQQPLALVEETPGQPSLYSITQRGESIIDTGTEIRTIAPLMELVSLSHRVWEQICGGSPFPVELYVLCLLAQEEIHRQFIRYTPECQEADRRRWTTDTIEQNRVLVLRSVRQALELLSVPDSPRLAVKLRDVLESWEPVRKIDSAYTGGAADSLLRQFAAVINWVHGKELRVVLRCLQNSAVTVGTRVPWRQVTEQLSWKARFLAQMLDTASATDGLRPSTADEQRALHLLTSCLRYGCPPDAIPLFSGRTSRIDRRGAVELIDAGVTPARILSSTGLPRRITTHRSSGQSAPLSKALTEKVQRLREGLGRYAYRNLVELAAELKESDREADPMRAAAHSFWVGLETKHEESVLEFRAVNGSSLRFDALVQDALDLSHHTRSPEPASRPAQGDAFRDDPEWVIRSKRVQGKAGVEWVVHRKGRLHKQLRLLGVELRRDWKASLGDRWQPFQDILAVEEHLVMIAMPWLSALDEMPQQVRVALRRRTTSAKTTTFVSPAACGAILTSTARSSGSLELLVRLLIHGGGEGAAHGAPASRGEPHDQAPAIQFVGVKEVLEAIDGKDSLRIRESLIQHFEVRPFGMD